MKKDLEAQVNKYFTPLKKIYLAIPYTGNEEESFQMANEVAAQLIALKQYVFSPISHSHHIAATGLVHDTYDTWLDLDEQFLNWCDEVVVVVPNNRGLIKGIGLVLKSKGVIQEILWAKQQNKDVSFVAYNTETKTIVPCDFQMS